MSTSTPVPAREHGTPELHHSEHSMPHWLPKLAWTTLALVVGFLVLRYWRNPPYSPDSWSYYELSKSIATDFFRINTYRNYQSPHPYGTSFGPLWPMAIWATAAATHTASHAGFITAFLCVAGTAAAIEAFGRSSSGIRGLGPIVTLGLLSFPPYADEVVAARSMPLTLMLLALLLWALSTVRRRGIWTAAAVGALAGGLVLTRADTLLALLLLAVLLLATAQHPRRRQALVAALAFTTVMIPWAAYGLIHFRTLLVTDNKIIASAVPQHYVTDVIKTHEVVTLQDDPWGWLQRVVGNVPLVAESWYQALILASHLVLLLAVVGLLMRIQGRGSGIRWLWLPIAALVSFTVQVAVAELTTRYLDARYLSSAVLLLLIAATCWILRGRVPGPINPRIAALIGLALVLLPAARTGWYQLTQVPPAADSTLSDTVIAQELDRCHDGSATLISQGALAVRHGALTGKRSGFFPGNLTAMSVSQRREWIADYKVGYLYVPPLPQGDEQALTAGLLDSPALLSAAATLTPDPCMRTGRLYRVSLSSP